MGYTLTLVLSLQGEGGEKELKTQDSKLNKEELI
jgi:hypothetical protein